MHVMICCGFHLDGFMLHVHSRNASIMHCIIYEKVETAHCNYRECLFLWDETTATASNTPIH
jgi:hypothetical protein